MIANTGAILRRAVAEDEPILFEGGQGSLLDVDHGTYPFVTSSSVTACGVPAGAGVPPSAIGRVVGLVKAYTTRVGAGPMPTEQDNEIGERIRQRGNEFGTTTGRPRRCGWFDAVAVKYAADLSGVGELALALLDVLSGFEELKICTGYRKNGQPVADFDPAALDGIECVYETMPGWAERNLRHPPVRRPARRGPTVRPGRREPGLQARGHHRRRGRPRGDHRPQHPGAGLQKMSRVTPETTAAARRDWASAQSASRGPSRSSSTATADGPRERDLPRTAGHAAGAEVVRNIVTEAAHLGLGALTLYSFSIENWHRPADEVQALMGLYAHYLAIERQTMSEHNIRFRHIGRRAGLPDSVLEEIDATTEATSTCTGMYLCLALNYGSRVEMTDAVRSIARRVKAGELSPEDVDEQLISQSLDTHDVPDPDLLIRTSGELRISNFLLWQLSYAEFYITDMYWPDFNADEFHKALRDFAGRHRRFGGLEPGT